MKKIFCILLMLLLALSLTACGEDEVAAEVQKKISDLGTITLGSERNIERAERAYEALTDKQRENVTNYEELVSARQEFEKLAQNYVTDELKKAEDAFAEDHNVRNFFLATSQLLVDAKQEYKQPVLDARERVKSLCYPGTHFISLRSFLEMTDSLTYDPQTMTVTVKAGTEVNSDVVRYAEYDSATMEPYSGLVNSQNVRAYGGYWFYGPEGFNVWSQIITTYTDEVLSQYSQTLGPETVDWGLAEDIGSSHVVYIDDTGAKLYLEQHTEGGSYYKYYYIEIFIKE